MKPILLSLSAAALMLPLLTQAAPGHHHDHGAAAPQTLVLNAGKKWATDEALRQGMGAIRTLAAGALPAAHAGRLKPAQYDALANDIDAQIGFIVEHCKLDPQADAQLHLVVGELSGGVEAMRGKRTGEARALGVVKVARSLNAYGRHFSHAGWQPVKLPH
ncbi:MAG: hypothetical protein B7X93_01795 [Hydrogenophilales bacterium 17-61-9]|nr:MAG: hypothetical protein B7X93_01795 [Hydrogenophilales bacterium 17-61-9]